MKRPALLELLAPQLAPHRGRLALALILGGVAALGLRAPFLLLDPLWNRVIFPPEGGAAAGAATADAGAQAGSGVLAGEFETLRAALVEGVFGPAGLDVDARASVLWTVGLLLVAIALVTALAHYAFHVVSRRVALQAVVELRQRLAEHLLGLSMRYHGSRRFGDLMSRMAEDVGQTLAVLRQSFKDLVLEPLLLLASLAIAALAAPLPTLVVVLLLGPLCLPFALLGRRVRERSRASLESLGASVQVLSQMLAGIRTVKAFRAEERELARYRASSRAYLGDSMRMERAVGLSRASNIFLSHLGFSLLVVGVGWLTLRLRLFEEPSRLMQFFGGLALAYTHLRRALDGLTKAQEASGAADRLATLLAEPRDEPGRALEPRQAHARASLARGLRLEGVRFRYPGAERDALAGIDLEVVAGETLALVGPSGAGKTTIVDLIARFLEPTAGRVLADGVDLRELSRDDWSRCFSIVEQQPFLFHATILENIRYGRPDATRAEVVAAAEAAEVDGFVRALPRGYDTEVGEGGALLSGGERQRITIARALLEGAPLLLLDEATSALDGESERLVQQALARLMQGRTAVVIAHRLATVRSATRIAVLEAGRLVEVGRHAELLERGGPYARLHATQLEREVVG